MGDLQNVIDILSVNYIPLESELQHVVFSIYTEEYAVNVINVKEIFRYQSFKPIKVPHTSKCIKGIVNFRGEVIPIIELRSLFGLRASNYDEQTAIIVLANRDKVFGLIVDKVNDVVTIPEGLIRQVVSPGNGGKNIYLKAAGDFEGRPVYLLDLNMIIDFQNVGCIGVMVS